MKEHDGTHIECKHLSAEYLQCRMDKCVGATMRLHERVAVAVPVVVTVAVVAH